MCRSISGSGHGDSGYVDQAIVQGATPMPRYDQVTVGNNEGNTEGFYHVLESRGIYVYISGMSAKCS